VNLRHVKLGYHYLIGNALYLLVIPVLLLIVSAQVKILGKYDLWEHPTLDLISVLSKSGLIGFILVVCFVSNRKPIYLVDFACYKPSEEFGVTKEYVVVHSKKSGLFDDGSLRFQKKILEKSGIGERTYFPGAILASPPRLIVKEARAEAEMVMFGALDEVFEKSKIMPKDICILVVNCSLFNPTPSLSAMIVSHYKMRENILSFNLGGMGCSAGIIALDLAREMLKVHGSSYALVVSTEILSLDWYHGTNRSMFLTNCLFRMGGAAILLSNKRKDRRRAKFELSHMVRTHKGSDDRSYKSVFQEEDGDNKRASPYPKISWKLQALHSK
jgi:3-ketoacyl-CoA synthase